MLLRRAVALPLGRDDMDQHRLVDPPRVLEHLQHGADIVAVHRAEISDTHVLKHHAGNHELLQRIFGPLDTLHHLRQIVVHGVVYFVAQMKIAVGGADVVEIHGKSAHIRADGHAVVVEHDDKICVQLGGIVDRLQRHAAGERAVSDNRHNRIIASLKVPRLHQAQPGGDGGGAVPGIEGIARTLLPLRKSAQPPVLPERVKLILAPGENFVRVGLMPHIPYQLVLREMKEQVQRHGEFHGSQVAREMPSGPADVLNQEVPDFLCQLRIVLRRDIPDIIWFLNRIQNIAHLQCVLVIRDWISVRRNSFSAERLSNRPSASRVSFSASRSACSSPCTEI